MRRQELVHGGVDQPDDHRQAVHRPEKSFEIGALEGQECGQGVVPFGGGLGQDHLLHIRQPHGLEEHVLGPAQADPLGSETARPFGVARVVGVGPHLQPAELVGPGEQLDQVRIAHVRQHGGNLAGVDVPGSAVDRYPDTFFEDLIADAHFAPLQIDVQGGDADDGRLAELTRHQRGVRCAPALAGQDPVGGEHAVDVVRLGLRANHDDLALLFLGPTLGQVGVEGDLADRRTGRDVQPAGDSLGGLDSGRVELRVQVEVDLIRLDPGDGLLARDQALFNHIHGDADLRLRRALAVARLQHPQLAAFDGEFDILHVAVVLLELATDPGELGVGPGHLVFQLGDRLGQPDPGDDVLALRVRQVVALDLLFTRAAATSHGHTGGAVAAHIAEDHRDDVHGRAQVVSDLGRVAVVDSALPVP